MLLKISCQPQNSMPIRVRTTFPEIVARSPLVVFYETQEETFFFIKNALPILFIFFFLF